MTKEYLLYLARAVSAVGNWMTFLAVALFVNEKFGADKVAYAFLISSMPALVLSNRAYQIIPQRTQKLAYFIGLGLMISNVLLLTFAEQLWQVYGYLLFASIVSAIIRPLLESLTAEAFEKEDLHRILTKVGGLTTSILCVAPPLGASLAASLGYNAVFFIDAASFLIAGLLLAVVFKDTSATNSNIEADLDIVKKPVFSLRELHLPQSLRSTLLTWYLVLILGALINAGEFGAFSVYGYSKSQIGLIVGCWGFGGLLAFLTAHHNMNTWLSALVTTYGFILAAFYLVPHAPVSCVLFVAAGFLSAKLGGIIRSMIQSNIPAEMRSLEIWGLVNSRLSLINMTVYGGVGFLIPHYGVTWIAVPLILFSVISLLI